MTKGTRWKNSEDMILLKKVTDFVSRGISIQEAFQILPSELPGRTASACYSRWYSYLEDIYGEALENAKQKQQGHAHNVIQSFLINNTEHHSEDHTNVDSLMPVFQYPLHESSDIKDMNSVIQYLIGISERYAQLEKENEQLNQELEAAWQDNESLRMEIVSSKEKESKLLILNELADRLESVNL
jgi:tRNA U38,U39,U40 pseudouridine synthase TruA